MVTVTDPNRVHDILRQARQRGATAGDVLVADNTSFDVEVRFGEVETIQNAHRKRLGLRPSG